MTYMPQFKLPATIFSDESQTHIEAELLRQLSSAGLSRLHSTHNLAASKSVYTDRLEAELQILEQRGYCSYFLIVADYVRWAKDNGIAVGPGRGSGPCSLVGYTLGITRVDPIKYKLPFERFINPDRNTLPDFDIEFCNKRFEEVAAYIQTKYGSERVAQISSENRTPQHSRLVIGDRPLADLVPVYANPESQFLVTELTTRQVKAAGLVQFNVIDQPALRELQNSVQRLASSAIQINLDHIRLDDQGAYHLLSAGETSHISLLDGEPYTSILKSVKPNRFEELCAVVALCYPNLRGKVSHYTERKHNPELIEYFHSTLESVTAETYGIILYQEQLMDICQQISGFSLSKGDCFRRALKNPAKEKLFIYRKQFIDGAIESGLAKDDATSLFEYVALAGRDTFNKSHAVAYAMMAYQSAWLKSNYASAL